MRARADIRSIGRAAIRRIWAGAAALTILAAPLATQTIPPSLGETVAPEPDTPILTIDQDRLFRESAYGRHVEQELERLTGELAAENRRIEAELTEEERRLTELRPTLGPREFTARADAFDARVGEIRQTQDAKGRDLARRREIARTDFIRSVLPVLSNIMRERGAVAILNAQTIFLSFDAIDITGRAIQRIDQRIGEGPGLPPARVDGLDGPSGAPAPDASGPGRNIPAPAPPQ
jgi:Skp family chaperone for outer membrane proteins